MIICGAAGGRGQTDQLVLVIHDFSIKLDCRHVFLFCFCTWKKKEKRRDGMSRGVLPFYSLTLWFEGASFHPRIISTHYNIPSHGSVWTPQCKTCSVTLFLSSSSECFLLSCAGERVHERVCNCVCACGCVLVEKCTKQIRYKINDILCHFFSVGKIYIYIGIDIVLPSVFLRCFCTIFVPKNGNCSTKISIYICLVSVFSEENKNGVSSALGMSWRSKMTWFSFFFSFLILNRAVPLLFLFFFKDCNKPLMLLK